MSLELERELQLMAAWLDEMAPPVTVAEIVGVSDTVDLPGRAFPRRRVLAAAATSAAAVALVALGVMWLKPSERVTNTVGGASTVTTSSATGTTSPATTAPTSAVTSTDVGFTVLTPGAPLPGFDLVAAATNPGTELGQRPQLVLPNDLMLWNTDHSRQVSVRVQRYDPRDSPELDRPPELVSSLGTPPADLLAATRRLDSESAAIYAARGLTVEELTELMLSTSRHPTTDAVIVEQPLDLDHAPLLSVYETTTATASYQGPGEARLDLRIYGDDPGAVEARRAFFALQMNGDTTGAVLIAGRRASYYQDPLNTALTWSYDDRTVVELAASRPEGAAVSLEEAIAILQSLVPVSPAEFGHPSSECLINDRPVQGAAPTTALFDPDRAVTSSSGQLEVRVHNDDLGARPVAHVVVEHTAGATDAVRGQPGQVDNPHYELWTVDLPPEATITAVISYAADGTELWRQCTS